MNIGDAISVCFKKYATFSGRASRSEYWYFYLFYVLVYFAAYIFAGQNVALFVSIPLWIPQLSVAVRRLHDVGKSGWFILIPIYNLILMCTDSNPGSNQYGER